MDPEWVAPRSNLTQQLVNAAPSDMEVLEEVDEDTTLVNLSPSTNSSRSSGHIGTPTRPIVPRMGSRRSFYEGGSTSAGTTGSFGHPSMMAGGPGPGSAGYSAGSFGAGSYGGSAIAGSYGNGPGPIPVSHGSASLAPTRRGSELTLGRSYSMDGMHSRSLSRRNSSIWLASMSMDVHQIHHSNVSIPSLAVAPTQPKSKFETLPFELITLILQYVAIDQNGPANLYRVLSTCGRIYDVGVATLYRHIIFRYPHTFDRFRWSIEVTGYGQHVRVLDFSAFTSVGLGRTRRMNMEIQMVSHLTLFRALELCPNIYEFLAGEAIDIDMSPDLIDKLLTMPVLTTIDFCGANDPTFIHALENSLFTVPDFALYNLTKLSLHCCNTIPGHVLEGIMSKLVSVTRLDLTHTLINESALLALPETAKLTHLSLARCQKLTSHSVLKFLVMHPATKHLQWLSLMYESNKPSPLSDTDLDTIIRFLPRKINHLNLNGLPISMKHLNMLNYQHLRSLCIANANVSLEDLRKFLPLCTQLRYIDLTGIAGITKWLLMAGEILNLNKGIEMFEFSHDIISGLNNVTIPGFIVNPGRGRRGWIHRQKQTAQQVQNEGVHEKKPFSFAQVAMERMKRGPSSNSPPPVKTTPTPPPASDPVWRFASHKVNVSEIGIGGVPTPAIYGHEGLYNYYSLFSI